jgi:hypothetical protein
MRRTLAALALCALLAFPAAAQGVYVGTWLYGEAGDDVKVVKLKVRDEHNVGWGDAVGTGFTPTLEIRKAYGSALYATVSGAWEDSTENAALFALGQAPCLVPTTGFIDYYAILVLSKVGVRGNFASDAQRQPFRFRVERWP